MPGCPGCTVEPLPAPPPPPPPPSSFAPELFTTVSGKVVSIASPAICPAPTPCPALFAPAPPSPPSPLMVQELTIIRIKQEAKLRTEPE